MHIHVTVSKEPPRATRCEKKPRAETLNGRLATSKVEQSYEDRVEIIQTHDVKKC